MRGIYERMSKTFCIAAISFYSFGCSTLGENIAKTVGNIAITPAKIAESTVKDLDPFKGARKGGLNTLESAVKTVSGGEAVQPEKDGEYNTFVEERPLLEAGIDAAGAYFLGRGIASSNSSRVHANQVGRYSAGAELGIKASKGLNK